MNIRKITSMTLLFSTIVLLINSIILYIVPEGRVAYWADWHLLGLTKTEWADQHTTVGVLFIIAGLLHIYYNWSPIKAYMKNKARELKIFTATFNVALVLTLLVVVGTYFQIPPMSTIITISQTIKTHGSEKYGEPPYGHAELSSLKLFAKKEQLDEEQALELLKSAGLSVEDSKESLKDIATRNSVTPQQVYDIIKSAKIEEENNENAFNVTFPDMPRPGFGNKKLEEVCAEYNLDKESIVAGLEGIGIHSETTMTIKAIGAENDKEAMEIFEAIRSLVIKE